MLIDDLVYFFVEKKRVKTKHYNYIDSVDNAKSFKEAAKLCEEFNLTPAIFVQTIYDNKVCSDAHFSPKSLSGKVARKILENSTDEYKIETTIHSLEYEDVWAQQYELAMIYIKRGECVESVLMDSGLKFFAWFRILATPKRCPEIVDKYKHIAKKELNPRLVDFIKKKQLDADRIIS